MEVAGVEAEQFVVLHRIAEIKLVGADDVTLGADAEQFALDGVAGELRVEAASAKISSSD